VITLVAELRTDKLPQIYLWEPDAYKDKVNSFTFVLRHRHRHRRPVGFVPHHPVRGEGLDHVSGRAALGWAVLIYIGIDFGFWGKVFDMSAGAERVWRACGEANPVGNVACVSCLPISICRAGTSATRTSPSHGLPHSPH
jgi:hypothetical protein